MTAVLIAAQIQWVSGQQFGRNKPHYTTFDFKVTNSPHFALHHYLKNDTVAEIFLGTAEDWYQYERKIFRDTFPDRNPVILYANHADFQQTTAIMGRIGVGTGGVTEALRNRIVMPMMELNAQTNHVLGHEMVHAFQYRMFKSSDSLSLANIQSIPLWMVEGLAEYLSIGNIDPHTAMWMRDAVREDDFPSLEDLTRGYEYFPYRYGQAFWAFVSGVFGDTVVYPLFLNTARVGYEEAIRSVTGLDEEAFSKVWKKNMIDYYARYKPPLKDDDLAGKLLIDPEKTGDLNIAPVLSPDGNYVAFLSQKNFFTIDLFLADARTGEVLRTLSSTAREGHIDDFSFVESAGTWSPKSDKFAFSVFSDGQNKLAIVDLGTNNTTTLEIPGVPYFTNPSWSPDGKRIVVSGMVSGQSDLYLFDPGEKRVTQITNDWFSDIQPKWSHDGTHIAFISDRPADGRSYAQKALQICFLEITDNSISTLDVFHGAENYNPVFAPDDQSVYFLSNRDGFRNLYSLELSSGDVYQLTDYFTGISGITGSSPAFSVSEETGNVCYTYYSKSRYSIYISPSSGFERRSVDPDHVDFGPGTLPPLHRAIDLVNPSISKIAFHPENEWDAPARPYRPKLALEYIGNEVGVGVSTGGFGTRTGMAGAVNMLFGDMLGYNRLFAGLSLNGEIYDFGGQVAYLNQRRRVNWGVSVSHVPYRAAFLGVRPDSIVTAQDTILTRNVILDVVRTFETSGSVFSYLILNTRQRLEAGAGYASYSMRHDRFETHYHLGVPVKEDRNKLDAPEGYKLGNLYAAYVFDNSYFGLTSPLRGKRYRFEAEKIYDVLDYQTYTLDYRQYLFMNPTSFAFRLLHVRRHGADAESERIYPLSFAYPTLTRGNSLDNIQGYSNAETGEFSINQIFGSRMLVGNVEWRVPLTGPERLAMIKSRIFFTQLSVFGDVGVAWNASSKPVWKQVAETPQERIPLLSTGLSLRVNLLGAIIVEAYYALPWRGDHFEKGVFGLNFAPGW